MVSVQLAYWTVSVIAPLSRYWLAVEQQQSVPYFASRSTPEKTSESLVQQQRPTGSSLLLLLVIGALLSCHPHWPPTPSHKLGSFLRPSFRDL